MNMHTQRGGTTLRENRSTPYVTRPGLCVGRVFAGESFSRKLTRDTDVDVSFILFFLSLRVTTLVSFRERIRDGGARRRFGSPTSVLGSGHDD